MIQPSQHQGDRQRVLLRFVGAAFVTGAVALQGSVSAASPEAAEQRSGPMTARAGAVGIMSDYGSRIGVSVDDIDSGSAPDNSGAEGAVVQAVDDDSPASEAGFQAGDIVVQFDGERVRGARQLSRLVRETPAGRQVPAVVVRNSQGCAST